MYEVVEKQRVSSDIVELIVKVPEVAKKAEPGHFLIVRVGEKSERIPLTIADFDREQGMITILVQEVGFSTEEICSLEPGDGFLDLAGPLGQAIEAKGYKKVICVAGGLGAAPLYPKVKSFYEEGAEVITILGAQTENKLIWEDKFRKLSEELYIATDDGSRGQEGFVTDVLEDLLPDKQNLELAIAIGPMIMMKAVCDLTADYDLKTLVSLNSIMVDGTGMCGGCRVTVGGENKFACVDGPTFDGHQVDFEEQMRRQNFYKEQESYLEEHEGGEYQCHKHQ